MPFTTFERKEELANILTHGIGVIFSIVATPFLVAQASINTSVLNTLGVAVYGFSFLFVFATSTAYHATFDMPYRRVLRIIDHISIYVLIAGSYTPFILLFGESERGYNLLYTLWVLTIFGALFKIFYTGKLEYFSVAIYLIMGWSIVIMPDEFFNRIPDLCLTFLWTGGFFYTMGVIFYLRDKMKFNHAIWHVFVLMGGIFHFFAIGVAVVK